MASVLCLGLAVPPGLKYRIASGGNLVRKRFKKGGSAAEVQSTNQQPIYSVPLVSLCALRRGNQMHGRRHSFTGRAIIAGISRGFKCG